MESLIYMIRHGEVDTPLPRSFLGRTDAPLNENGIRQALFLREMLKDIPFTNIFTSPLQRAIHTAALIGNVSPDSLKLVQQFQEINLGDWEGLTVEEVQHLFPGAYEQRGQDLEHFRPEGGESFADVAVRSYPALLSLTEFFPGPLLVITHAGVIRVLLSLLQQHPLQELLEIPQRYCGINILNYEDKLFTVKVINGGNKEI